MYLYLKGIFMQMCAFLLVLYPTSILYLKAINDFWPAHPIWVVRSRIITVDLSGNQEQYFAFHVTGLRSKF